MNDLSNGEFKSSLALYTISKPTFSLISYSLLDIALQDQNLNLTRWPRMPNHYSNTPIPPQQNAPRIHNIGHIFQIAKVPSGVCKIRPAFLLDSATFLAIASAGGNVQEGSCVSGRYFTFSKIREFIKNPIQQTYERTEYNTMKPRIQQDTSANLCGNILGHCWECKEYQTTLSGIIRTQHECNKIRQFWAFNTTLLPLLGQ